MSGFSFPPPPPPPPAAAAPTPPTQQGHRGGFNNRVFRGRGRGNTRGGFHRGGHHQYQSQKPSTNGSLAPSQSGRFQAAASQESDYKHTQTTAANGHSTSYNITQTQSLNHSNRPEPGSQSRHDMNQSMMIGSSNQTGFISQHQSSQGEVSYSGSKRKRDQAFNTSPPKSAQVKPESKPKVPPPPAVPSFGFALPANPPPIDSTPVSNTQRPNKKKHRKNNLLGLTPQGEIHRDSDDDVDEEAMFMQNDQKISIQHRGRSIQLNTAADVAAWIAERRKQYPTQARVAARKAADEAARKKAQEARETERERHQGEKATAELTKKKEKNLKRKDKLKQSKREGQNSLSRNGVEQVEVKNGPGADDPLARIALLEEQLRQAREALTRAPKHEPSEPVNSGSMDSAESGLQMAVTEESVDDLAANTLPTISIAGYNETSEVAKHRDVNLGLTYSTDDGDSANGSMSELSSEEPSSSSSDLDSGSDSDSDAPPVAESSKSKRPINVPPPSAQDPNKSQICKQFANSGKCRYGDKCMRSHEAVCRYFARHGHCKYGDKCRMSHDVTPNTGKGGATTRERTKIMTLRERMVEEELRGEAKLGLQVIKQLGELGFFQAT